MAATALIQLTQGGNVGTAGQALFGSTGTQVDITNNVNTSILSWQIDILYVPPGSSISTGTLAFSDNGSTPAGSFTPDLRGPYRLQLKVWDSINRPGNPTDTDIRNFGIKEVNGIYRPAPEIWPRPLPPTASGLLGNKPDENNFAGQPNGWSGDGSDGLLDTALQRIDKAVRIAAGTQTGSTGAIVLSDSNGISFGMSGSSRITASYTVPSVAGLISAVNISGGTTSNNLTSLVFSNSNNFSFGLNGSTITGSYTVPTVTNSSATISAGTKSETLSNLVFSNSNGLSFGLSNGTITGSYTVPNVPAQTVQTQNVVVPAGSNTTYTSGTVVFTGSNAVTVRSTTGQAIVIDVPIQTAQTQNIVVPSAGTQTATSGTVVFSDSNGISFGMSGSSRITASYTVPSTVGLISNVNISAGTTSNDGKSFVFSNSNNVSFGLNGSTITATISVPAQTNQTEGRYAIGNTTGQSSSSTFDARTLSLSGAGIISLGYSANALVVSASQSAQTQSNVQGISAGTQVGRTGDIVFSNSNGVTFGMSGSNTVTASHNGLTVAIQSISAGTTRATNGEVIFSNSNGVSFGMNAGTITATVNPGAAAGIAAIQGGTQTATSGTIVFSDSNGVSFGLSGSTRMTASVATSLTNINFSAGTTSNNLSAIVFSNSNGVSFGLNASTVTGSVATSLTNINASAGTTSNNLSAIVFSNSNGISFGLNGSTVTGSVATSLTNINVSAGTTSNNLSAIVFSNSNNFSFGMNGSTVTGSYTVPTQTNQTVGLYALGNTTQNSSTTLDARTISFNGLGAMTVGYSNGSVQLSVPVQTAQTQSLIQAIYDGANSITTGTIRFTNANGVSFSINGQTISGSVAAQTNQTVGLYALGNTTQNSSTTLDARTLSFNGLGGNTVGYSNGSIQISGVTTNNLISGVNFSAGTTSNNTTAIVFSNLNGVTFGLNAGTITASVAGAAAGIAAVSAGTQSKTSGTLIFSNSNNITFGMSGSNTITASYSQSNQTVGFYAVGNTTQNSSTTLDARTVSFNAIGGITAGYSNGSIQLSAPGASSLSVTGALSMSINADTISLGIPVRNVSHLMWPEVPWGTNFSISNASFSLQHFNPAVDMTASQANFLMALSGNTNSTGALTVSMGIYTMSGSTMSLASSDSRAITWTSGSATTTATVYGGISGTRYRTLSLANWAITAGDYMLGVWFRTTNDGTWRAFGIQGPTIVGAVDANETGQYLNGFSTSSFTTAMIASVNVTATNFVRTGAAALQQPSMIFLGSF